MHRSFKMIFFYFFVLQYLEITLSCKSWLQKWFWTDFFLTYFQKSTCNDKNQVSLSVQEVFSIIFKSHTGCFKLVISGQKGQSRRVGKMIISVLFYKIKRYIENPCIFWNKRSEAYKREANFLKRPLFSTTLWHDFLFDSRLDSFESSTLDFQSRYSRPQS